MMLSSMCRRFTRWTKANNISYINRYFNPQSHQQREIRIQRPVPYYRDNNNDTRFETTMESLRRDEIEVTESKEERERRIKYDFEEVYNIESYIDSAFRSTKMNEVYLFFQNEYAVLNYTPGTTSARVVDGPRFVGNGFHSLVGTYFCEYGIDAAFGCHGGNNESYIFSGQFCARINYAPGTTNDKILEGPMQIKDMFPFFRGTSFKVSIDAAFESSVPNEVYLFKDGEYALVDYIQRKLIAIRPIVDGFNCLQNTIFDNDIGAAFASHNPQEAYMFKGNSYVLLHFTPGQNKDCIISGPKEIVPANWPSLENILPRYNVKCDMIDLPEEMSLGPQPEYDLNFSNRVCNFE